MIKELFWDTPIENIKHASRHSWFLYIKYVLFGVSMLGFPGGIVSSFLWIFAPLFGGTAAFVLFLFNIYIGFILGNGAYALGVRS